ncbi:MAG: zinc ribbon domain-containing protein [Anaerolineae bacterium]|nr:zinc ribbon domain-containing protein [Anaerolineae bacterium]
MVCPKCGNACADGDNFCRTCGTALHKEPALPTAQISTATDHSISAGGDAYNAGHNIVIAGDGARVIIGEPEVETPAVAHDVTLSRYLSYIISRNRYLHL